ncbi:c-type cytochrome [Diaphorobacter ruginosibacter]|uniref:C-type cytochrome n=1 Tax=Diaphorobacter ruginosibacter TaxID=1715720 RepID=A0A7G9RJ58_9BURK|nr:c-type cytochrome [Diaphorobacter ruginosibacter]
MTSVNTSIPQAYPQSSLQMGGEQSGPFVELTLVMVAGASLILLGIMALLAFSFSHHDRIHARLWLIGGGVLLPVGVLIALFLYSESVRPAWKPIPPPDALVVTVQGRMWWWEVSYHDAASGQRFVTANEIRLPRGRPVYFALTSQDVLHSFWIPALGGKMDMVPGRIEHLLLTPTVEGLWRGQCAEFCGTQHGLMALDVLVTSEHQFASWAQAQAQPAPAASLDHPGRSAFLRHRCNACHDVRGLAEGSQGSSAPRGPDLTHVGGRLSLGAATLPNTPRDMQRWVNHTQEIKPGARMPSGEGRIPHSELEDIAAWLSSLR